MYEELKKLNVEHYLPAAIRAEYEALLWDVQIDEDAASGKLDKLFGEAKATAPRHEEIRMTQDIVERLRDWAGNYEEGSFDTEEMLMREAADEIERLEASQGHWMREARRILQDNYLALDKIEVAEARIAELNRGCDKLNDDADKWHSKYMSAEAKLATAVKALDDLMSWFPDEPSKPEWRLAAGVYGADDAVSAARAALKEIGGGDD